MTPSLERSCAKRTCLLIVQPWSLSKAMEGELLSYAKKLRARGVFVACLTYADSVQADFIRASDLSFFMRSGIFGRFSGISVKEAARLCSEPVFLGSDYPKFISLLDDALEKRGIGTILVVGGFKEACALAVAKYMCRCSRISGLKVRLVERLLMSACGTHAGPEFARRIASYRQASGCDISVSKSDPGSIYLKYFS